MALPKFIELNNLRLFAVRLQSMRHGNNVNGSYVKHF